ncbi:signal peptidase I [Microbacterium sp.]|uniref:signal peptidase I n=1 Tax=Microbacterium sp. TaxID=51671 RepID=UPI0039E2278D
MAEPVTGRSAVDRAAAVSGAAAAGSASGEALAQAEASVVGSAEAARLSRPRAVLRAVGTAAMGALLVLLVGIGVVAIVIPALTGSVALTVRTSSMEPSLPPGTMVVVRPTAIDEIEPGDVLTYQLHSGEPTLVTHRVTQRMLLADGTPVFVTKGDANAQPDLDPVRPVQVRGIVWYAIPYIGWVATVLSGDLRAIVVTVLVCGLLGYAAWMFVSAARDRFAARRRSVR